MMSLSAAQRERYGRAIIAHANAAGTFSPTWEQVEESTREIACGEAEAVIAAYVKDQAARQAAMERVVGLAIDYRDMARTAKQASRDTVRILGAPGYGKYQAVERSKAAHEQARRCLDELIAAVDALDATEQEAGK